MLLRYADQKLHTSLCNKTEQVCVTRHVLNSDTQTSLGWDKLSEGFPSRRVAKQEASRLLTMGSAAMYLPETTSKGGCSISEASSSGPSPSSGSSCSSDSDGSGSPSKSAPEPDNVQWLLSEGGRGHLRLRKPVALQTKRRHTAVTVACLNQTMEWAC